MSEQPTNELHIDELAKKYTGEYSHISLDDHKLMIRIAIQDLSLNDLAIDQMYQFYQKTVTHDLLEKIRADPKSVLTRGAYMLDFLFYIRDAFIRQNMPHIPDITDVL